MLSYQHIYHAGSLTDIHKHSILISLLNSLISKDNPLNYFDTHAGRGVYNLASPEANKTGEAKAGILNILKNDLFAKNDPFLKIILTIQKEYGKDFYPGSAIIAQKLLRSKDSLYLMELHPQEFAHLLKMKHLRGPKIQLFKADGYSKTLALLPKQQHQSIIFIDPSYEVKAEYKQAVDFIEKILLTRPHSIVILWYPILSLGFHHELIEKLRKKKKFCINEEIFKNPKIGSILGSGIITIGL